MLHGVKVLCSNNELATRLIGAAKINEVLIVHRRHICFLVFCVDVWVLAATSPEQPNRQIAESPRRSFGPNRRIARRYPTIRRDSDNPAGQQQPPAPHCDLQQCQRCPCPRSPCAPPAHRQQLPYRRIHANPLRSARDSQVRAGSLLRASEPADEERLRPSMNAETA